MTFQDLQQPAVRAKAAEMVFVTTTDGNHGRGVAWAAKELGSTAHVYLPAGSAPVRAQAIREAGAAEARILELDYDDAVRYAARMAEEKGWHLIQDTSWPGYEDVPAWIVQGYATMAREAAERGGDLAQMFSIPAREKIGRAKSVPANQYMDNYANIMVEMDEEINAIAEKGEEAL